MTHAPSLSVFIVSMKLFVITEAGGVPCGGPNKSSRAPSLVQIIFETLSSR